MRQRMPLEPARSTAPARNVSSLRLGECITHSLYMIPSIYHYYIDFRSLIRPSTLSQPAANGSFNFNLGFKPQPSVETSQSMVQKMANSYARSSEDMEGYPQDFLC